MPRFRAFLLRWICVAWLPLQLSAANYLTQDQALELAFKEPSTSKRHELMFDDVHRKEIEARSGEKILQKGLLAYSGVLKSGGNGVVLFDAVIGKHEFIDYMVILSQDGKVVQIEILAYRESYGGEVRKDSWRKQFEGTSLQSPPEHQKNILNISGATMSCRHVTEGVRKLLYAAQAYSKELGIKP